MGSEHPIALQTMTTTDTRNVAATVEQVRAWLGGAGWLVRTGGGGGGDACGRGKGGGGDGQAQG